MQFPRLLFSIMMFLMTQFETAHASFPKDFRFGVATSAHQIEGGNVHSDWWVWEKIPGKIKNGDRSGSATDHWNRFDEDLKLLLELGVQEYRFSVEWAKIEPQEGLWDFQAIEWYRIAIQKLIANGIRPFLTLQHFTLPDWLQKQGGFRASQFPLFFERYVRFVYEHAASDVLDFVTINEPLVVLGGGYLNGFFPPGHSNQFEMFADGVEGMLRAHALAYRALHNDSGKQGKKIQVGFAHHLRVFEPARVLNPMDHLIAAGIDRVWNWAFPNAIETGFLSLHLPGVLKRKKAIPGLKGTQDFFGVNYYSRDKIAFDLSEKTKFRFVIDPKTPKTDVHWEIYPEGLYRVLKWIHERYPRLKIRITENGTADHHDRFRAKFLVDHLGAVQRAIREGVQVESYDHWSLLDNFEWSEGFEPRFGLCEVDYQTFKRTPRPSFYEYQKLIRSK